jgi:hypothetical protein
LSSPYSPISPPALSSPPPPPAPPRALYYEQTIAIGKTAILLVVLLHLGKISYFDSLSLQQTILVSSRAAMKFRLRLVFKSYKQIHLFCNFFFATRFFSLISFGGRS